MKARCVCGCGKSAAAQHHVVTQQELKKWKTSRRSWGSLKRDKRNLVPVAFDCHGAHHHRGTRGRKLPLHVLPNKVFVFAREVMGPGPAYEYLRRYYGGGDPRLDELLAAAASDVAG